MPGSNAQILKNEFGFDTAAAREELVGSPVRRRSGKSWMLGRAVARWRSSSPNTDSTLRPWTWTPSPSSASGSAPSKQER